MSFRLRAAKSASLLSLADDSMSDALNEKNLESSCDFSCAKHFKRDWLLKVSYLKELFIIKKRKSNNHEREKELKSIKIICCHKR